MPVDPLPADDDGARRLPRRPRAALARHRLRREHGARPGLPDTGRGDRRAARGRPRGAGVRQGHDGLPLSRGAQVRRPADRGGARLPDPRPAGGDRLPLPPEPGAHLAGGRVRPGAGDLRGRRRRHRDRAAGARFRRPRAQPARAGPRLLRGGRHPVPARRPDLAAAGAARLVAGGPLARGGRAKHRHRAAAGHGAGRGPGRRPRPVRPAARPAAALRVAAGAPAAAATWLDALIACQAGRLGPAVDAVALALPHRYGLLGG